MHGGSQCEMAENCQVEFTQHVGVGLEPLVSCLIPNRQFAYLLTADKPSAFALM